MAMSEDEFDFFDELLSDGSEEDSNFTGEVVDADEIINSLHLSVPELNTPVRTAPKMTDLGFKMSQMILKQGVAAQAASSPLELEEGDALVDNYGTRRVRHRPGKRGRPKGTVKDATTQFGRTSSTHALPPAVAALMGRANVAYVQRKYDEAVELYLQVVQRAPSSPEPYYSLGLVWEERGDADRAASYFLISAHLQGKADAELWRKIAALLVQCPERKEQAIYALTRAIKCVRRAGKELYLLRAKLHLELHQYRQVISGLGGLIRQQLSNSASVEEVEEEFDIFGFLARIALHMSLAYLAAAVLEESLNWALKHGFALNYNHLNLLTELRAVDEDWLGVLMAIEAFLPTCHQSTGAEQGRTEWWLLSDAQKLTRALQSTPVELRFAYQLASFRLRRPEGTLEALLTAFDGLAEEKPTALIRQLTDALMEAGEFAEALKIYLSPECTQMTTPMCLKMIEAYMRLGDFSSAEESVYAILHVNQDSKEARLLLADIFRATGRIEEALQILPDDTNAPAGEEKPEKEFINWQALDSLFDRSLGVHLEVNAELSAEAPIEVESSDSSGTATPSTSRRRLRFGPERIKRSKSAKIVRERRPMTTAQIATLKQKMKAVKGGDLKAAEAVLTACMATDGTGLSREDWSEAVGEAALLQARQNSCDFGALLRVLRSILESSQLSNDARLHLMTLLAASKAQAHSDVLFQLRWFISRNPNSPRPFQLLATLAAQSDELRLLELSSNFFRFLARRQAAHPTSFPLHLALGHQSLTTHNYDEAARQYWQAAQLAPQNCSLSLCLGNALLWRSFQRTCVNQPAKLLESLAHFQKQSGTVRGKYNLARAFQIAGFKAEAVRIYREIEEEFLPAKYNLSRLLLL